MVNFPKVDLNTNPRNRPLLRNRLLSRSSLHSRNGILLKIKNRLFLKNNLFLKKGNLSKIETFVAQKYYLKIQTSKIAYFWNITYFSRLAYFLKTLIDDEGNCETVELNPEYKIFIVLLQRKCRKISINKQESHYCQQ